MKQEDLLQRTMRHFFHWLIEQIVAAVKHFGSECCLEAPNTTQSLKLRPINEERNGRVAR